MAGVKTLEFLIAASPDKRRLSSLADVASQHPECERSGYSKVGQRWSDIHFLIKYFVMSPCMCNTIVTVFVHTIS